MATDYSGRYTKTLGCGSTAMGGAASGLGLEALTGDTEMVTVFDDFNHNMPSVAFPVVATGDAATNVWEDCGWTLSDAGTTTTPVAGFVRMNDIATVTCDYSSCIEIYTGTADDEGGNMQLDLINADLASAANNLTALSGRHNFPHIWVPETATVPAGGDLAGAAGDAGEAMDNTTWMFACRAGFRSDWLGAAGAGDWNSKAFIGWARAGEAAIMTPATGVLAVAAANDLLVGFHIPEDGSIDGISQGRDGTTAYAAGTNFTELVAAGGVDNTVANNAAVAYSTIWYDLALRFDVTDMSLDAGNGTTTFYYRQVIPGTTLSPWTVHTTQLSNQTPNSGVSLVPTIEVINGPTAGRDGGILLDWWAFGRNRVNR